VAFRVLTSIFSEKISLANDGLFVLDGLFVHEGLYVYVHGFSNKSGTVTLRKNDQSKRKIDRHHHSMLVLIYSKCHEILPASCIEMAANMDF